MNSTSNPKFQIYQSGKEYRFRLLAKNGRIILSGEAYTTKQNCLKGINSVQKYAQQDEFYKNRKSSNEKFYFVLKASNGEIIGSSQKYSSISGRNTGIKSVKTNASKASFHDLTKD